ncbi:hypothetical protein [Clostridium sp.]|uniref:hypothetical protein n=1 Tax=Clostridium sp. TaxID=1506 RepID=UPI002603FFA5|nr:hypothetical protein [Clostridium sp.]
MNLVKVKDNFYNECIKKGTTKELMFNEKGRPCVLIVRLKYKSKQRKFIVPLRSNVAASAPSWQYFPLPPNNNTRSGNKHAIHYIKLFPITNKYIDKYNIENNDFLQMIDDKITSNKKEVVDKCQEYLSNYEMGKGHSMTPDIDGILEWLEDE